MIALLGMPRSGTTWIGKIFDSHPLTLYRHEPDMGLMAGGLIAGRIPYLAPLADAASLADDVRDLLELMLRRKTARTSGKTPFFAKDYYTPATFRLRKTLAIVAKVASRLHPDFPIPDCVDLTKRTDIQIVWKSINLAGCLGVIANNLVGGKAFLILRHPCGQINSVMQGEAFRRFTSSTPASEDYGVMELLLRTEGAKAYGLDMATIRGMLPVERLAWRWVLINEKAVSEARQLDNCMIVRYEAVCAEPVAQAKQLFDFAGLEWHTQTREFIAGSTSETDDSYYGVQKRPLEAANKWRQQMTESNVARIMNIVHGSALASNYVD